MTGTSATSLIVKVNNNNNNINSNIIMYSTNEFHIQKVCQLFLPR
jgi:hypothetical protein